MQAHFVGARAVRARCVATLASSKPRRPTTFSMRTTRAQFPGLLLLFSFEGSRLHLFLLSRSYRD